MYHFGVTTSFDHTCNSWSTYKNRMNQWFIANDITPTSDPEGVKRRAILLSALSDRTYRVAVNLALPDEIQDVPFNDIMKLLDTRFTRKRLGFVERYKFYSAQQNVHETEVEFLDRLRRLSKHCEFTNLEETLRDRFVLGLRLGQARDQLMEEKLEDVTLTGALEIAGRARSLQEINDAQKLRTQPFFGGVNVQPYQPPFVSGQGLFGTEAQTRQVGLKFGTQQSATTFGGAQTKTGQAGFFGTQAQSSQIAFGGTQTGQVASFGAPKPPVGGQLFGVPRTAGGLMFGTPKPQPEQATPSGDIETEQGKPENPVG